MLWNIIQFSSHAVRIVEPVEGWIKRAASRCEAIGLTSLGRSLKGHAASEAGHHLMLISDTHALVNRWNEVYSPQLDATFLLDREPTPGANRYIAIHETIVGGDRPFAQVRSNMKSSSFPLRSAPN